MRRIEKPCLDTLSLKSLPSHISGFENLTARDFNFGVARKTSVTFTGDDKANILTGGNAGDTLNGEGGADTLTGGGGSDIFVIAKEDSGVYIIKDFTVAQNDKIRFKILRKGLEH